MLPQLTIEEDQSASILRFQMHLSAMELLLVFRLVIQHEIDELRDVDVIDRDLGLVLFVIISSCCLAPSRF